MTEPDGGQSRTSETAWDDSSHSGDRPNARNAGIPDRIRASGPWGWLVLALGASAAILLFAAELATLSYRTIGIGGCDSREDPGVCVTSGGDAHSYGLWLLALLVILLALGAAVGRSRPAGLGVIACGVVALIIALAVDAPDLGDTRGLEARYTQVHAHTGTAFWLEIIGGALAVLCGVAALMRGTREAGAGPSPGSPPSGPRSRPRLRLPGRSEPEPQTREERAAARAAKRNR